MKQHAQFSFQVFIWMLQNVSCNFTDAESNLLHLEEITQLKRLIHVICLMPLLHDILQRSLMHCISIPYSLPSQSVWEY